MAADFRRSRLERDWMSGVGVGAAGDENGRMIGMTSVSGL